MKRIGSLQRKTSKGSKSGYVGFKKWVSLPFVDSRHGRFRFDRKGCLAWEKVEMVTEIIGSLEITKIGAIFSRICNYRDITLAIS